MTRAFFASTIVALFMVACAAENGDELNGGRGGPGDNPGDPSGDPGANGGPGGEGTVPGATPPAADSCKGSPHVGFAGFDFVSDRKAGDIGVNRSRVKPYSALAGEFTRALGAVPTELATSAATFGQAPARWFVEPSAGAVTTYTMYNLSFTGCYDTMTGANYTVMPTAATAQTECAAMQRKFWQRTGTADELKACTDFVMSLTDEPLARRRWAHACASILTSTGFTTY